MRSWIVPSFPSSRRGGNPDVTIRLLPPAANALESLENGYYEVQPGIFRLAVPGVAQYRVEEGRRIFIAPLPDVPARKVTPVFVGLGHGRFALPARIVSASWKRVETPWGAMIFVGAQGAGKSTLAAQFHRKGYRLLSDDVCAVAPTPEGLQILPALAQFRLCADAFERLGATRARALTWINCGAHGRGLLPSPGVAQGDSCPRPRPRLQVPAWLQYSRCFQALTGYSASWRIFIRPHYLKGRGRKAI
jgi:hypothetical protein